MIPVPAVASFLRHIPQSHSSKLMTIVQPPGAQSAVNLLQLKLGHAYMRTFTPRVQSQEINMHFLGI
jgi:hypothetical protein